jgi:hypothetical protein
LQGFPAVFLLYVHFHGKYYATAREYVPVHNVQERKNMNPRALFHESIYDALVEDITAIGGYKVVAGKLWPAESPSTATPKLRNSVNPEQAAKLAPEEVLAIKRLAKDYGSFATITFESRELSFDITWIQAADEAARTQQRCHEMLEQIQKELKRSSDLLAQNKTLLRAVK